MYSFTPNGRRRGLHAVVIVDLTASVLLWTSATAGGSYGWIFQLAGVVLAVLGIYLITRYSLRSYTSPCRTANWSIPPATPSMTS